MWTRAQVKAKGKASFKANYWKSVLIALVLALALGGTAFSSQLPNLTGVTGYERVHSSSATSEPADGWDEYDGSIDVNGDGSDGSIDIDSNGDWDGHDGGIDVHSNGDHVHVGKDGIRVNTDNGDTVQVEDPFDSVSFGTMVALTAGVVFIVLAVLAIGFALDAFLLNPLEVGARRFFITNLNRPAETKELGSAFDNNYIQGVKTMFLRDLFTFLWGLLFVIPGVVKFYEYRMIPYLIAENPQMDRETAFAESKRLTDGQKWNMFVLDLSFIGWDILSVLTAGLLSVFYVAPYRAATNAALYEALRYGTGNQPQTGLPQGTVPPAGYGQAPYGQNQYGQAPYGQAPYGQPNPADPMAGYAQPMPFAQQPVQYGQPAPSDQPVPPASYTQQPMQPSMQPQQQEPTQQDAPIPLPAVTEGQAAEPGQPVADPDQPAVDPEQPADPTDTPDDLLG